MKRLFPGPMLDQPRISVVMPAYNAAQTVQRAINSVLLQSFKDFEVIIVDDGSKDNTVQRVAELKDLRIRLLQQPENRGGNAARNRGIREARASVVCFLDCDDEFLAHKLEFIDAYFEAHPDVDAVIDSFELRYPTEKGGGASPRLNPVLTSSTAVRAGIFNRTIYKATPALSVRKDALNKVGMFDETLRRRQDMDLVLRLSAQAEIRTIANQLWTKHWTQGAISSKQKTFMPALLDILDRHPDYLGNQDFRPGLARDFTRHFLRLLAQGALSQAKTDWQNFATRQPAFNRANLALQGLREITKRSGKPVD
jgi:glycosyltransferase involved in cell wall biosynthesis